MPLLCFEKRRSLTEHDDSEDDGEDDMGSLDSSIWQDIPDSILLHIFSFLDVVDLGCVAQSCKTWNRVSLDESLWKGQLCSALHMTSGHLVPGERTWRGEMRRVRYQVPTVLTETITEHTDEVLHVSFSHNGSLFSTTSKDATLKVWRVGYPTTLKYSKDFRELLDWDFTQFSSFNESDTMVLVSSVKSTHLLMDRRGYMAILSLVHDFEILRVVTMDPSQLFGAWLDDTTFLGGSVEISLDRFATTVQIEAHEVPEIFSVLPLPDSPPMVEESSGQPILTFNSETASLIKFLTVANIVSEDENGFDKAASPRVKDHDKTVAKEHLSTSDIDMNVGVSSVHKLGDVDDLSTSDIDMNVDVHVKCDKTLIGSDESSTSGIRTNTEGNEANQLVIDHIGQVEGCSVDDIDDTENNESDISESGLRHCRHSLNCVSTTEQALGDRLVCDSSYRRGLTESTMEEKHRPANLELFESGSKSMGIIGKREKIKKTTDTLVCDSSYRKDLTESTLEEKHRPTNLELFESGSKSMGIIGKREKIKKTTNKNLILVTGEFAVALHQIGFKNVPAYSRESVLASGATPMDADDPEGFMVVNYSNNDIHIVHRQQELDMPDHLIDLFGHVTGLCLTSDQRYLFINCRPWVGDIDRSDPWATPDLSANIEVRIIDLHTLKDLGVRYKGHTGFSPPNMCCFVFLDVSQDFVASGSEDAKGYLWDRHYQSVLATYEHGPGVVNAVGFCPYNQEYLVTVSDDKTIKVWRSRSEVKRLQINMGEKDIKVDCARVKCQ